ncbi:MerR family transcriptional regulator [Desulfocurvus sp. DL9XJH121]
MGRTYRIGKAAKLLDLNTSVLRYWESEFPQIRPIRTPKGQRLYNDGHLELLKRIQYLLHDEGLTIEGARKRLELDQRAADEANPDAKVDALKRELHDELLELRKLLRNSET